jgi:hypothetical protein
MALSLYSDSSTASAYITSDSIVPIFYNIRQGTTAATTAIDTYYTLLNTATTTTNRVASVEYRMQWIETTAFDSYAPTFIPAGIYRIETSNGRPPTPAERLKEILQKRLRPDIISNCKPLGLAGDIREIRARETLHRVIGEEKFRDFVKRGFISVRAKSGRIYQIFPGRDFTNVYDRGKMIERLCVVMSGDYPPTDSLIMRYLIILNNEDQFRKLANKHDAYKNNIVPFQQDQRPLTEIFRELKKVA